MQLHECIHATMLLPSVEESWSTPRSVPHADHAAKIWTAALRVVVAPLEDHEEADFARKHERKAISGHEVRYAPVIPCSSMNPLYHEARPKPCACP
jgi:hypothetical protein